MRDYKNIFDDPVMYRITFAQNILTKDDDPGFVAECLDDLVCVMKDPSQPFETQADVCDFFLHTENKHITALHVQEAGDKMRELFRENMVSELSIYANRQNVHSESIEESSQEVLKKLHETYGLVPTTLDQLQQWRLELEGWDLFQQQGEDMRLKTTLCMNRIFFDKRLYGHTKDTLVSIFGLVWRHIHHSEHREELQKRLLEEMNEASGQCSTGIAMRLLNTLSGYDDFMLKISYREAILTKVMHLLNKQILAIDDPEHQEELLHEMILPSSDYTRRKKFLGFFRTHIPSLKEELYEEYKEFVSDTDFDLYLKQALIVYEGHAS
jgi:predicted house-cleaning noncanonical NTP pyrophosphatase (MazG superfamily)